MREVEARLKISAIDRTGRVLANVGNKLDAVSKKATLVNRAQSAMFERLGFLARAAVPALAAYEMVRATDKAADFQEALFKIEKKSGATKEQMAKLGDEIRSLFTDMPVKSIEEMATAFERGATAGIPLEDLREFAKLTLMIADGWDTTAEDTANFMAGFNKGLGIPIDKMEAFASLINDLADSGIADEKDIADFLDRAGASLKNFGLTPEQIAAYGAAMLNLKIPSEVAARAMDTLTGKLLAPENLSPKSKTALTAIVGDLKQFSKLSGNEKMQRFMKSLRSMTNQRKASLLGALLGEGFDDEIMRVVSAYDEVERNQSMVAKHMANASHSVTALYQKQQGLFNKQWQILKNNLADVEQSFGERLLPMATRFVEEMNRGFKAFRELEEGRKKTSGGDPGLEANQRSEFIKRYAALMPEFNGDSIWGSATNSRANIEHYPKALRAVAQGRFKNVWGYLSDEHRRRLGSMYSGGPRRRFANSRNAGNLPANWLGGRTSGLMPAPLGRYETMMQDYYRQGGHVAASGLADPSRFVPASRLNAAMGDPTADRAVAASVRRKNIWRLDRRQQELDGIKGQSSAYGDALREMSRLSLALDKGGQSIGEGGNKFESSVDRASARFEAAVNKAAAVLGNVKVNVSTNTVNANLGKTNEFARAPGTGRQ